MLHLLNFFFFKKSNILVRREDFNDKYKALSCNLHVTAKKNEKRRGSFGVRITEMFGLNRSCCETKKRFQLSEMFVTKLSRCRYKTL